MISFLLASLITPYNHSNFQENWSKPMMQGIFFTSQNIKPRKITFSENIHVYSDLHGSFENVARPLKMTDRKKN